jgi:hypothetical protein
MTQPIEKNGAGDGARTRDLRRDRPEGPLSLSTVCSENKAPESARVSERPLCAEWRPVSQKPSENMPVLFYSVTRDWHNADAQPGAPLCPSQPWRCERTDIGYFEDGEWYWQGTGHAVWEWDYQQDNPNQPTHWMPLPSPPENPILSERVL